MSSSVALLCSCCLGQIILPATGMSMECSTYLMVIGGRVSSASDVLSPLISSLCLGRYSQCVCLNQLCSYMCTLHCKKDYFNFVSNHKKALHLNTKYRTCCRFYSLSTALCYSAHPCWLCTTCGKVRHWKLFVLVHN